MKDDLLTYGFIEKFQEPPEMTIDDKIGYEKWLKEVNTPWSIRNIGEEERIFEMKKELKKDQSINDSMILKTKHWNIVSIVIFIGTIITIAEYFLF